LDTKESSKDSSFAFGIKSSHTELSFEQGRQQLKTAGPKADCYRPHASAHIFTGAWVDLGGGSAAVIALKSMELSNKKLLLMVVNGG